MKSIIVNATALRADGALTILHQFLDAIPDDQFEYIIFVDDTVTNIKPKQNVKIIKKKTVSFFSRFIWDLFGLQHWLNQHLIKPIVAISLQNTNFRLNTKCSNFIYYHQSVPLYPYKWNPFKPEESKLWFYKNIYPIFVKLLINSRTEIFVQQNFIKESFSLKYKFPKNKIHVVFPSFIIPKFNQEYIGTSNNRDKFNLFYPATAYFYKNHELLIKSLRFIDNKINKKISLYLTIKENEIVFPKYLKNIEIVFCGKLPYNEVINLYIETDVLVFPSYVETLGLPLLEAATNGLPIIVSDLPYSHEVLEGYKGVTYINYQDPEAWGNEIIRLSLLPKKRYEFKKLDDHKSWEAFFNIIKPKT